uniref:VWFA domain-containing protein n=1 Tax=Heterorhabditis bacteriophora TaxID=37862 RepID=A0A1I7X4F0_HETBA
MWQRFMTREWNLNGSLCPIHHILQTSPTDFCLFLSLDNQRRNKQVNSGNDLKESVKLFCFIEYTCPPLLDMAFVLDTSGSIEEIYQEHVRWTVAIVDALPVHREAVRVTTIQLVYPTIDGI